MFGMRFDILWKTVMMKNFKKYLAVTLTTLLIAFLTLSVTTSHGKRYRGYERPVLVEEWMTTPFTDSVEEPLEVEDWMTRPFNIN